jgi:hypothetical protein
MTDTYRIYHESTYFITNVPPHEYPGFPSLIMIK